MERPLVSIIIPHYKYDKYILDCLLSCIHQSYQNVEIIVIDDASPDGSIELIKKALFWDPRIKLLRHAANFGYSAAKNTGIKASSGKYIRPLDADDMLTKEGISTLVSQLDSDSSLDMVHGIAYKLDGKRSGHGYTQAVRLEHKLPLDKRPEIHAQGVLYHRECHNKWGLYYEPLRSRADKEFWKRMQLKGANLKKIKVPVAYYRFHDQSMQAMRNRNPDYNQKMTNILNKRLKEVEEIGLTKKNTLWP